MKISNVMSAITEKLWCSPKSRLSQKVKEKCEAMPHRQRLTVVTILLSVFVVVAFLVFGHACYRIGLGHRSNIEIEHIRQIELKSNKPINSSVNDVDREP